MKEYLQVMIWVMLFVIVVEMIFPDSDYRKYLKLVLGCIIIYILFRPIANIVLADENSYDHLVKSYEAQLNNRGQEDAIQKEYKRILIKQKEVLEDAYKETIRNTIESQINVRVVSCKISFKEDQKSETLAVEKIEIIVREEGDTDLKKMPLPEMGIANKNDEAITREEKLKNKIKTCLENFYIVQDCNIYITVQKNL